MWEPSSATTWAGIESFGQQAGQQVRYVVTYLGPDAPFPARLGAAAAAHNAEPILQLNPSMSMAEVTAGQDDAYLSRLAAQIRAYGHQVIMSWAPEANGNWSQWGAPQTPPEQYRAAWQHVMGVFHGVHNVTWMVTINRTYATAAPTSDYIIPGVDMYGIDAYYSFPDDTFESVFGQTIAQIRAVTTKPILISETGIGQAAVQVRNIPGLVAGVRAQHLAGLVYFNENQGTMSSYHQDWALTPAALTVLRAALRTGP